MTRFLLPALVLALGSAHAAQAEDSAGIDSIAMDKSRAAKLVEFDGAQKLLTTAKRLRIWRAAISYRLTVDAEGKPTECEMTQAFRRNFVNSSLCNILVEHHAFEPALDTAGTPIAGSYSNSLTYKDLRAAK